MGASSSKAAARAHHHHKVVVVGGGISGLFTAKKLLDTGIKDVLVLEGRGSVGGRVVTRRDKDGGAIFNDFAWRVGEENTMMIALAKELGLTLKLQHTPKSTKKDSVTSTADPVKIGKNRAPLSQFAAASLESASAADKQDRESGYAGRTAQISFPGDKHGENNYYVEEGMSAYASELEKRLPEGMVKKMSRVTNVKKLVGKGDGKNYEISVIERDFKTMSSYTLTAEKVVLAAPPFVLRTFDVAKDMQPALFAVNERRLGHCFAKLADGTPNMPDTSDSSDRIYRMLPDSILQQIVSGDYGNGAGKGIFQAAYACDRFERVWRELQFQGPDAMREQVMAQLEKLGDVDPALAQNIEEVYLRINYVHRWQIEAHVMGKTKEELSLQAITPNPALLPELYLVGEAFSPFQGWTEGALWTADKAAGIISSGKGMSKHSIPETVEQDSDGKVVDGSMLYNGHIIDTSDWASRHPGGPGPIKGFLGRDVTEFFNSFHLGNPQPLATLFGLQQGTAKPST